MSLVAHFAHEVEPCNTNSLPTFVPGKCPRVTVIPEFNVTRYLGDWYAQRQTTSSFQPVGQVKPKPNCLIYRVTILEGKNLPLNYIWDAPLSCMDSR